MKITPPKCALQNRLFANFRPILSYILFLRGPGPAALVLSPDTLCRVDTLLEGPLAESGLCNSGKLSLCWVAEYNHVDVDL